MPSIQKLVKTAAIGGIITASCGYFLRYHYYRRVRTTKTYKEALELLRNHEKAVKYLGEPIKEGKIQFGRSVEDTRSFSVVLNGANTRGKLDCEFQLKGKTQQPEIRKLEIKFADIPNQIFVIQEA